MKLVKSLLLGTAAGLAAVAGAQAADLPFRKAAPVDYVRVCDWTKDAGYFYIPGTDTCLRIGGEVRFEYAYVDPKTTFVPTPFSTLAGSSGNTFPSRFRSASGFFSRGKIETDVRTQTAYGLLRAFVRFQGDATGGNYNDNGLIGTGGDASGVILDRAFIEFAGFTAGRRQSFYDFYADNYNYNGIATSDSSSSVLAYTATFGGGFSATISVEDARSGHSDGIKSIAFGNTAIGAAANTAPFPFANGGTVGYGGEQYPDVIGLVRYDNDSWGAVQLSAAYHDINTVNTSTPALPGKDGTGFAASAGLYLKLPMIAAGDELWLQGQYQEGAVLYMEESGSLSNAYYGTNLGGFIHQDADAVAVGNFGTNNYHLELARGFSVLGAFQHYFTPQFHDVLYGSYEEIGYGSQVKNISWQRGGIGDASQYKIGNQFIFTPVHNFDIGVDVMYTKLNQDIAHEVGVSNGASKAAFKAAHPGVSTDPDSFEVRLRLNRDF